MAKILILSNEIPCVIDRLLEKHDYKRNGDIINEIESTAKTTADLNISTDSQAFKRMLSNDKNTLIRMCETTNADTHITETVYYGYYSPTLAGYVTICEYDETKKWLLTDNDGQEQLIPYKEPEAIDECPNVYNGL